MDVGSSLAPHGHAAFLMPTGCVVTLPGLTRLAKQTVKAHLAIYYSYIFTVWIASVLECGYNIKNRMDFSYSDNIVGFCKSGYIIISYVFQKLLNY